MFDRSEWVRLVHEDIPIYVRPERPDWFVPNASGDAVLEALATGHRPDATERLFLDRLPPAGETADYAGRAGVLSTDRLDELWLHVTDRCDMACRHCLFSCTPAGGVELPADRVLGLAREAHELGARLFAVTGGEPFVHREATRLFAGLLELDEASLVVLTNGMSLVENRALLERMPRERLHLQVSIDGLEESHDRLRGKGSYARLCSQLRFLADEGWPFTLASCIDRGNQSEMPGLVDLAAELGASGLHFMWYFVRGRGAASGSPDMAGLARSLIEASQLADERGIVIDNILALRSQVFTPPGTKHDGSLSAWRSLAVGPDDRLFPSPALVEVDDLATPINGSLAEAWRASRPLGRIREASVARHAGPLRYLLGGGDLDHSYIHAGTLLGDDPYLPMHEAVALWLIAREARRQSADGPPRLRLKMGDVLDSCADVVADVALTHSNCVLALSDGGGTTAVGRFYAEAAEETKADILNPVCYSEELLTHVPEEGRIRSYGCGSPVLDAGIVPGETVCDLGSGTGVECFIAARLVGAEGRVVGVDMLDPMLAIARETAKGVRRNLGYDNLRFEKGLLESLPLEDSSVDVILSNCVLNLSHDKRRTFGEIRRVLRPGGRLVVSDVVCEDEPGPAIRNDETLRGECLGGALTQRDLFGLLDESGFSQARVVKRFPYRRIRGHAFFSMTFEARVSAPAEEVSAMYRGPLRAIWAKDGTLLPAGQTVRVSRDALAGTGDELFILDDDGHVANLDIGDGSCCSATVEGSSCCSAPPEVGPAAEEGRAGMTSCCSPAAGAVTLERRRTGCMLCGAELEYLPEERLQTCSYCGVESASAMGCSQGHFVCDGCHGAGAQEIIERGCLASDETDMVALLHRVRAHPAFSIHGPEHHALVPGVILAACRNAGADIDDDAIRRGIRRGAKIPGGSCAYLGVCGAASGVGAAFSVLLEATPTTPTQRQTVLGVAEKVLGRIAEFEAARCCQRDCYLGLQVAAELIPNVFGVKPRAEIELRCNQIKDNAECAGAICPLHPAHEPTGP